MVWETLPVIRPAAGCDQPDEAIWPFIPAYSEGRLPHNREGRLISTANARLRRDGAPFAPTFMGAWRANARVLVAVSWFYEFDSRVRPQIPYAVFPLDAPCWLMAGLGRMTRMGDGSQRLTVAVITVDPNDVLMGVGHHRSPALMRSPEEARRWLDAEADEALELLRPYPNETMGVEAMPMDVKIPGNEAFDLPNALQTR
jgi:putative SOS response-associated peptidase YedK